MAFQDPPGQEPLLLGDIRILTPRWIQWLRDLVTTNTPIGLSGLSVTITTAQLTALGAQGSMTFVNGVLTAQTQAT